MNLSVIVPSYNQAQYLSTTLRSIVDQPVKAQVIVIDGGSTDGSVDVIRSFGSKISYWVSEKDRGLSDALNKGLKVASGDLIGWQNSDDYYLPGAFARLAEVYRDDIDVFFGDMVLVSEAGEVTRRMRYAPFTVNDILFYGNVMTNQSAFFRRTFLIEAGGWNVGMRVAMDGELYLRLRSRSSRFCHIPHPLGALRIYGDTITSRSTADGSSTSEWAGIRRGYGVEMQPGVPWGKQFRARKYGFLAKKALYLMRTGAFSYVVRGMLQRNALKQDW